MLDAKKITIKEVVEARKQKIEADAAWNLLSKAESITVSRGKKIFTLNPKTADKMDILALVMGPSGSLKAPALREGNRFMVGWNPDMYAQWLG